MKGYEGGGGWEGGGVVKGESVRQRARFVPVLHVFSQGRWRMGVKPLCSVAIVTLHMKQS